MELTRSPKLEEEIKQSCLNNQRSESTSHILRESIIVPFPHRQGKEKCVSLTDLVKKKGLLTLNNEIQSKQKTSHFVFEQSKLKSPSTDTHQYLAPQQNKISKLLGSGQIQPEVKVGGFYKNLQIQLNKSLYFNNEKLQSFHQRSQTLRNLSQYGRTLNIKLRQTHEISSLNITHEYYNQSNKNDSSLLQSANETKLPSTKNLINASIQSPSLERSRTNTQAQGSVHWDLKMLRAKQSTLQNQKYFCSYLRQSLKKFQAQTILDIRYIEGLYRFLKLFKCSNFARSQPQSLSPIFHLQTKITVIFGLEQTLVCFDQNLDNLSDLPKLVVKQYDSDKETSFRIRPEAQDLISQLCINFDVGIFTGLNKVLADEIIQYLDPRGLIKLKFYQNSCLLNQLGIVKDIKLVERSPKRLVLVDAVLSSVVCNIDSAIPIIPFHGQNKDRQLNMLGKFLNGKILNSKDINQTISDHFKLKSWVKFQNGQEAVKMLYN